jgi:hypothetical protein
MLDVWPPLPIEIECHSVDRQVEDDVIAALERPNRVRSILLSRMTIPLERLVAVMQDPLPAMDSLSLQIDESREPGPALPNTFLGGSAPRLRSLRLTRIPFPTLPRLLLSSNDLVDLHLEQIPHSGYISPEAMATCISALTSLFRLSIGFISPASRPDPTTRHPPSLTRAVLPTLITFYFHGVSEYLEDLIAQIDTPQLHTVTITFFNQLVFGFQQLPQFIIHRPTLDTPDTAKIFTYSDRVKMTFSSERSIDDFTFQILSRRIDWQVSSVAQICNQVSFILSSIEELDIDDRGSIWQVDMDDIQWLELFQPFTAVRTLRTGISDNIQSLVVSALRGLSGESAMQVLSALEELQLSGYEASQHDNWPFTIVRRHSDHPVVVLRELRWY